MRIKLVGTNKKDDKEQLKMNHFEIVEKDETHILIESKDYTLIGKDKDFIPSEVLYVESFGNDVFAHTLNDTVKISIRLYEFDEKYKELGFMQINKSYVVNLHSITSVYPLLNMRYIVKITNGDELIVTRTYLKQFKQALKGGTL